MIEYKIVQRLVDDGKSSTLKEEELNELGAEGWVLCAILPTVQYGYSLSPAYHFWRIKD